VVDTNNSEILNQRAATENVPVSGAPRLFIVMLAIAIPVMVAWIGLLGWGATRMTVWVVGTFPNLR
jgi:hypothetical protein